MISNGIKRKAPFKFGFSISLLAMFITGSIAAAQTTQFAYQGKLTDCPSRFLRGRRQVADTGCTANGAMASEPTALSIVVWKEQRRRAANDIG
jgi:hypothetical protein